MRCQSLGIREGHLDLDTSKGRLKRSEVKFSILILQFFPLAEYLGPESEMVINKFTCQVVLNHTITIKSLKEHVQNQTLINDEQNKP